MIDATWDGLQGSLRGKKYVSTLTAYLPLSMVVHFGKKERESYLWG